MSGIFISEWTNTSKPFMRKIIIIINITICVDGKYLKFSSHDGKKLRIEHRRAYFDYKINDINLKIWRKS
jgi:hypothetical protein